MSNIDFDSAPDESEQQQAPDQSAQPAQQSQPIDFASAPDESADSSLVSGVKSFARTAVPNTLGAIAGVAAGAGLLETGAGALAAVPAGFAVGGGVAYGAQKVQDALTNAMGITDPDQTAADATNHPIATTVGELATAPITFGVDTGAAISKRLLSGAIVGGMNLVQQGIEKGPSNISPTEALVAAGVGAALPGTTQIGKLGELSGMNAARAARGEPAMSMADMIKGQVTPADPNAPKDTMAGTPAQAAVTPVEIKPERPIAPDVDTTLNAQLGNEPAPAPPPDEGNIGLGDQSSTMLGTSAEAPQQGAEPYTGPDRRVLASEARAGEDRRQGMTPKAAQGQTDEPLTDAEMASPAGEPGQPPAKAPGPKEPAQEQVNPAAPDQVNPAKSLPGEDVPGFLKRNPDNVVPDVKPAEAELPLEGGTGEAPIKFASAPDESLPAPKRGEPGSQPTFPTSDISLPKNQTAPAPSEYRPGEIRDAMAGNKPAPQSLSGAATEPGKRNFTSATQSAVAKGGLIKAIKNFGPVKWFNQAFNIAGMTDHTEQMERITRQGQGENNRDFATYQHNMDELAGAANKASADDRSEAVNQFQTGIKKTNALGPFSDSALNAQKSIDAQLKTHDPDGNWQKNFLPKMFDDVQGVKNWMIDRADKGNMSVPTIGEIRDEGGFDLRSDVLRQDGTPDVLRTIQAYHLNVANFLEGKKIVNLGENDPKFPIFFRDDANGSLKPLDGMTKGSVQLYAQPEVATMFNRYMGAHADDVSEKDFWKSAQKVKNYGNMWSLLGGLYHMNAETVEAMTGNMMGAISQAAAGRFTEAGKKIAGTPTAPYRQAKSAADLFNSKYYKGDFVGPRTQAESAVEYLIKAGVAPGRTANYTPDINSARDNFFGGWGKGAAALSLSESGQQLKNIKGPTEAVNTAFGLLGKGMNAIMHPMFNVYIPRLKTGAMMEQMTDFMAANADHPERFQDAAIKIAKSTDDRLGEMNQSTLFWNKVLQRSANLLMLSPGWEVGTLRAGMGGAASFLKNPKSLSITNPDFHPNSAWPFAFAIMTAATGMMYQFLKTGKMPEDMRDPFFPQTGGKAANSDQPERAMQPGYSKDVYSWEHQLMGTEGMTRNASTMLYNKLASVPRAFWDTMANKDWAGKQLYNPSDPLLQKMQQYLHYVTHESLRPIMAQQISKAVGAEGSNISVPEAAFGYRAAPKAIEDPAQSQEGIAKANKKAQQESDKFHKKYGG